MGVRRLTLTLRFHRTLIELQPLHNVSFEKWIKFLIIFQLGNEFTTNEA